MTDEPEYVGLMAEAWDALRGDTSDWADRRLFLDLIREQGGPALDVGCGTGRLLLDYRSLGLDIDGIDNSAEMLTILRRKARQAGVDVEGRVFCESMDAMRLDRRYRTIIIPSSSFQLLTEPAAAREALRRFFNHLEPGGKLAMPFIRFGAASEERSTTEAPLLDGSHVRRTSAASYDPVTRVESTDDLYEVFREGKLVRTERFTRQAATRAWSPGEITAELSQAGFRSVEQLSGFTREPARDDDPIFTVLARRPVGGDR